MMTLNHSLPTRLSGVCVTVLVASLLTACGGSPGGGASAAQVPPASTTIRTTAPTANVAAPITTTAPALPTTMEMADVLALQQSFSSANGAIGRFMNQSNRCSTSPTTATALAACLDRGYRGSRLAARLDALTATLASDASDLSPGSCRTRLETLSAPVAATRSMFTKVNDAQKALKPLPKDLDATMAAFIRASRALDVSSGSNASSLFIHDCLVSG
jgi:hypothetical protein